MKNRYYRKTTTVRKSPRSFRTPSLRLDLEEDISLDQEPTVEQLQEEPSPASEELELIEHEKTFKRELTETSNAYTLYLREIGQTKLLTPQEEVVLAKRIHRGDEKARVIKGVA